MLGLIFSVVFVVVFRTFGFDISFGIDIVLVFFFGILSVLLFVKVRGMFFIVVDDDLFSDFESSFYDY